MIVETPVRMKVRVLNVLSDRDEGLSVREIAFHLKEYEEPEIRQCLEELSQDELCC